MSFSFSGIHGHLLDVTVVECHKLKDTEWISRQDPYVCLEYGGNKFRTRTCTDGGKNPIFQEKFVFTLIEGLREINVVIWNSNTLTYDDFIGGGKIILEEVLARGYDDRSWTLQTKTGRSAGEVKLIMHYANANANADVNRSLPSSATPSAPPYMPQHQHQPPVYNPHTNPTVAYPPPPSASYPPPPPPTAYPPPHTAYPPTSPYPYPPNPSSYPPYTYPPPPLDHSIYAPPHHDHSIYLPPGSYPPPPSMYHPPPPPHILSYPPPGHYPVGYPPPPY